MTVNVLTPGHIQILEKLSPFKVIIGLLTKKGLRGYKKEYMPFEDRKFILTRITSAKIVPQDSLNPYFNLKKYKCDIIASGDGFEPVEISAMKKLDIAPLTIKLKGEKRKRYSSSKIINKIKQK